MDFCYILHICDMKYGWLKQKISIYKSVIQSRKAGFADTNTSEKKKKEKLFWWPKSIYWRANVDDDIRHIFDETSTTMKASSERNSYATVVFFCGLYFWLSDWPARLICCAMLQCYMCFMLIDSNVTALARCWPRRFIFAFYFWTRRYMYLCWGDVTIDHSSMKCNIGSDPIIRALEIRWRNYT
jgi:hypothetical protein